MSIVLVTGANGRLGSAVCAALVEGGVEIRKTDRFTKPGSALRTEVVNLKDREACYRLVEGVETVVHLGNNPHPHSRDPQSLFVENNALNVNVFQAAAEMGVKHILFASSIQVVMGTRVYDPDLPIQAPGCLPYLPIDGDTPPHPENTYGASKRCGEVLLEMYSRVNGIDTAAIRFPYMAPRDRFKFFRNQRQTLHRNVALDEALTYMSYEDATQLVLAMIRRPKKGFTVVQPAAATMVFNITMEEALKLYPGVALKRPAEELKCLVDLEVIERQYGWRPKDDLHVEA